jgi:hypothetical protein
VHYDPRARRLRRPGRAHGDRGATARRHPGRPGLGALPQEERPRAAGLPRAAGRRGDAGREHGLLVAGRPQAGLEARRDLQGRGLDPQPRPDGRPPQDERPGHGHGHSPGERRHAQTVRQPLSPPQTPNAPSTSPRG